MFLFAHATTLENFLKILKRGCIISSTKSQISRMTESEYIFANIITLGLTLRPDENAGL